MEAGVVVTLETEAVYAKVCVELGHQMRLLRLDRRERLIDVQLKTGVSATHLSQFERGMRLPGFHIVLALLRHYDVTLVLRADGRVALYNPTELRRFYRIPPLE